MIDFNEEFGFIFDRDFEFVDFWLRLSMSLMKERTSKVKLLKMIYFYLPRYETSKCMNKISASATQKNVWQFPNKQAQECFNRRRTFIIYHEPFNELIFEARLFCIGASKIQCSDRTLNI